MKKTDLENKQQHVEEWIEEIAQRQGLSDRVSIFPIYDGVGDIKEYLSSNPRIAYLLKEPYDEISDGKAQGGGWSIQRDCFMRQDQKWTNLTFQRVIYSVYGLRNRLKYIEMKHIRDNLSMGKVLRSIAWINLSKMPAQTHSDSTYIESFKKYWKDVVQEQLKAYSPDVIICGNVFDICREELFPQVKLIQTIPAKENMKDIAVYGSNKTLVFDVAHPGIIGKSQDALGYYVDSINETIRNLWKMR